MTLLVDEVRKQEPQHKWLRFTQPSLYISVAWRQMPQYFTATYVGMVVVIYRYQQRPLNR